MNQKEGRRRRGAEEHGRRGDRERGQKLSSSKIFWRAGAPRS
jgi:hypothetical protein